MASLFFFMHATLPLALTRSSAVCPMRVEHTYPTDTKPKYKTSTDADTDMGTDTDNDTDADADADADSNTDVDTVTDMDMDTDTGMDTNLIRIWIRIPTNAARHDIRGG